MKTRSVLPIATLLCFAFVTNAMAQDEVAASISGRVFANGMPVIELIQVRLERQDSSLIANAYTRGTNEFVFQNVTLRSNEKSYFVIEAPGFKELRYSFDLHDLFKNRYSARYSNSSLFILELEKLPREGQGQLPGSKVISIQTLSTAIPDEAQREYKLGNEALAKGNSVVALKHLEKAVELAPKYYDAVSKLGAEYLKAGQYDKAEVALNQARVLDPKDPITLTNLGALYFQEGAASASAAPDADGGLKAAESSFRNAANVLEEARQLDPRSPRTNYYLGTVLYRIGEYEKAESLLLSALAADGNMQDARLSLLNVYIRLRRYDDALAQISAYLETNPDVSRREQVEKLRTQIKNAQSQREEEF